MATTKAYVSRLASRLPAETAASMRTLAKVQIGTGPVPATETALQMAGMRWGDKR
jgi:hypothetical protein